MLTVYLLCSCVFFQKSTRSCHRSRSVTVQMTRTPQATMFRRSPWRPQTTLPRGGSLAAVPKRGYTQYTGPSSSSPPSCFPSALSITDTTCRVGGPQLPLIGHLVESCNHGPRYSDMCGRVVGRKREGCTTMPGGPAGSANTGETWPSDNKPRIYSIYKQ